MRAVAVVVWRPTGDPGAGAGRPTLPQLEGRVRPVLRPEDRAWMHDGHLAVRFDRVRSPGVAQRLAQRLREALQPLAADAHDLAVGIALGPAEVSDAVLARRAAAAARVGHGHQTVVATAGRGDAPGSDGLTAVTDRRSGLASSRPTTPRPIGSSFLGRADELNALGQAWAAARAGRPSLVGIEGPAGIGKTSLLRRFVDTAMPGGLLWASGDEDERALPWGVLCQLAASGAAGSQLAQLAASLEPGSDPLLVGAGLLAALDAGEGLVVVLDDAHWADAESLAALRFVLRRLVSEPILFLLSFRSQSVGTLGDGWRRLLYAEGTSQLRLSGLEPVELIRMAAAMGKGSLSPAGAANLHAHTAGHPFYARLLLEQLPPRVFERSVGPLPAPRDLASAIGARLAACAPETRALVAAAAVLGRPCRLATAGAVAGIGRSGEALADAVAAGLLAEVPGSGGQVVAFPHRLVRAAVYDDLGPARRRQLHGRAAVAETGRAALAHRVACADGADEALAAGLEEEGRAHLRRGALGQAATSLVQAFHLTPAGPDRSNRLREALEVLLVSGDAAGAQQLGADLASLPADAWTDYVLGYLALLSARPGEAQERFGRAWATLAAGTPPPEGAPSDLAARIASQLAILAVVQFAYPEMLRFGDAAVQTGEAEGWVAAFAWFARTIGRGLRGEGVEALAELDRAGSAHGPGGLDRLVARGMVRLWTDDAAGAHADLSEAHERACRGEPLRVAQALGYLGESCYRLGHLEEAMLHAELAVANAEESGRLWDLALLHGIACYPRAARGDWPEAEDHARAAAAWSEQVGTGASRTYAALARVALADARGDTPAFLDAARDLEAVYDSREPGTHLAGPALAEALLRTGDPEGAEEALAAFAARAAAVGRRSAEAAVARVRGELAGARSRWSEASAAFEDAVRLSAGLPHPLEAARIEVAWGRVALACGARQEAARHLLAALRGFRAMGAHAYVTAVADTLRQSGLDPDAGGHAMADLTPTEAAVARLVAERLSNAEVAARLSMSPKTVAFHLTHVYAKLGVTSRRQLAASLDVPARS